MQLSLVLLKTITLRIISKPSKHDLKLFKMAD